MPPYLSLTYIVAIDLCVLCVSVVRSTHSPAKLYESQKRYSEAESLYLRALALVTNVLGEIQRLKCVFYPLTT